MKKLIGIFLMLGASMSVFAQANEPAPAPLSASEGVFQSVTNASVARSGDELLLTVTNTHTPITIVFARCVGVGIEREDHQWWVLPINAPGSSIDAGALWVLPMDATSKDRSWHLMLRGGNLRAVKSGSGLTVTVSAQSVTLSQAEARPHSDPFGHRFSLRIASG